MGTINEVLAVECDNCVVVDLVDRLIELLLDGLAVSIRVRVVCCVDDLFLQGLQDLNCGAYCTLCNLHHALAVLGVLVVLVEGTDLYAHALGYCIAGCVICCAVDLHARRDLCKALCECAGVLVQCVQRADCGHVVLYYHCHDIFLLDLAGILPGFPVRLYLLFAGSFPQAELP